MIKTFVNNFDMIRESNIEELFSHSRLANCSVSQIIRKFVIRNVFTFLCTIAIALSTLRLHFPLKEQIFKSSTSAEYQIFVVRVV